MLWCGMPGSSGVECLLIDHDRGRYPALAILETSRFAAVGPRESVRWGSGIRLHAGRTPRSPAEDLCNARCFEQWQGARYLPPATRSADAAQGLPGAADPALRSRHRRVVESVAGLDRLVRRGTSEPS